MSLKMPSATMTRVESSFTQLAHAAQLLNSASEELSKVIRNLDASMKRLALGVAAWVPVSGTSDEIQYWTTELGYAKVDGKWGLTLREVTGFHPDSSDETEQVWPYADAPRALRAEAVTKIPDLLDNLLQQTHDATNALKEKIDQASELSTLVSDLTPISTPVEPQPFHRPGVGPLKTQSLLRRSDQESQESGKPVSVRKEPEPLPVERVAPAANTSPTAFTRFREVEPVSVPAPAARTGTPRAV